MADFSTVFTKDACPPAGPYLHPSPDNPQSQAIKTSSQIYVSGQIPADATGALIEGDIGAKTACCIQNIVAILAAAGSSLSHVVKVNVFITDMDNFAAMNAVYEKHFVDKPARSCVAVKQLPKGVPVEIECIAVVGSPKL